VLRLHVESLYAPSATKGLGGNIRSTRTLRGQVEKGQPYFVDRWIVSDGDCGRFQVFHRKTKMSFEDDIDVLISAEI
jgi:hypothetical protein